MSDAPDQQSRIHCRQAGPGDVLMLADFAEHTFKETYAPVNRAGDIEFYLAEAFGIENQRLSLADPAIETLMCFVNDTLAGYMELRQSPAPACVGVKIPLEIRRFYIDQPWQGRGVASILMEAVFDAARARQACGVWLGVWEHNSRAQAFYSKCGFVKVGQHVFNLGSSLQTDFIMVRQLAVR